MSEHQPPIVVGRYLLHRKIARGGMATIHIARLLGDVGFSRIVAAKRMHPELAEDDEFVAMFLDEARIASRVQHRNVVNVLDVVTLGEEVMLVQEYVHGAPLGVLLRAAYDSKSPVPVPVAAAIACHILAGLHAAHETTDELGTPLHIVHRDVSPQNILIATDGTARLLDFGVAKAALSAHVTRKGTFKGKLGYSSPEQIRGEAQRQSDIYSLAVVLWELLVGHRMHSLAQSDQQLIAEIMNGNTPTITEALAEERTYMGAYRWTQLATIEPVIRKALDTNPRRRWETAAEMEEALAAAVPLAPHSDVAAWLRAVGKEFLEERERLIAEEEVSWRRNSQTLARGRSTRESDSAMRPPSVATEPHAAPLVETTPTLLRRIPNAFIAALVFALFAGVAFLVRDLDDSKPMRATSLFDLPLTPATAVAPPPTPATAPLPAAASPASRVVPGPVAPAAASEIEASDEEAVPTSDLEVPPQEPVAKPRPARRVVRQTPPRQPAPARTTPPPPPPPSPRPAAASVDCSTPFYFEGRKKVFKPGCL